MYIHAYQSYVWNVVVSKRIELSPHKILVGDLVSTLHDNDIDLEEGIADDAEMETSMDESSIRKESKLFKSVKLIETEEDAARYTMQHLVLPLPGYAVQYPKNVIGQYYIEIMEKDGLNPHSMKRNTK